MSIDLNWETVTAGPEGQALAHEIRDFIHDKFQAIPLPRFIKSVTVHNFEFGSIPPELELKDITDPLPDFYEENPALGDSDLEDDDDDDGDDDSADDGAHVPAELRAATERRRKVETTLAESNPAHQNRRTATTGVARNTVPPQDLGSPFLGVPGRTLNLHYFHSQFATGLPGTHTPLAAVAGAQHLGNSWLDSGLAHSSSAPNLHQRFAGPSSGGGGDVGVDGAAPPGHSHSRNASQSSISAGDDSSPVQRLAHSTAVPAPGSAAGLGITGALREKHSVSTLAPTSAGGASRPPTRDTMVIAEDADDDDNYEDYHHPHHRVGAGNPTGPSQQQPQQQQPQQQPPQPQPQQPQTQGRFREPRVEDIQAVFRIRYAGDVKLQLTTEILLDYPMPSFVGIPVRLSITGLTFDGVGVVAYIRKRVHFCFLSPEDALVAVGTDGQSGDGGSGSTQEPGASDGRSGGGKVGGLLQEIRVESEIGQRESGKQSLKNVGKVERFVLEQVRRIFEEEFVYPSFWTFLV